jgi:hypothetical protein
MAMTNNPQEQAGNKSVPDNIHLDSDVQNAEFQPVGDKNPDAVEALSAEPELIGATVNGDISDATDGAVFAGQEETVLPENDDIPVGFTGEGDDISGGEVEESGEKEAAEDTDSEAEEDSAVPEDDIAVGVSSGDEEINDEEPFSEEEDVDTEASRNNEDMAGEDGGLQETDETTDEKEEVPEEEIDFTGLSREELVNYLRKIISKGEITGSIKDAIDAIKFQFYKKLKAENEQSRLEYVRSGGVEEDYIYEEDALELILKSQLNKYRELRNIQNEQLEAQKQSNLEEKLKIIEELKELTNSSESIGGTFHIFRDLQNRWRAVGLVPQTEVKNLWDTYHHYVEVFYDYIKINKELRDLDFKRNLEAKINLCEKAESLLLDPSVVRAFNTLQAYHEQWREIGPVPQEMREEIWERFKSASSQINRKHQEYYDTLRETQKQNLEAKTALCEKVEEITQRPLETMSQWDKSAKEIIDLQKLWNTIGYTPKKDSVKLYRRFNSLCDKFFSKRREFLGAEKTVQENNLQLKKDMCVQAEALKDSTEWKSTTEDLIKLQKKWKETGNVPVKHREAIWKRFRSACDYFFEQKAKHFSSVDSEYDNNLKAKQELVEQIRNFTHVGNPEKDFEKLQKFQRQWSEIGFVPIKYKKKIQDEYREAINKQFDLLKLSDTEKEKLRYKSKIENLVSSSQSRNKIESERDRLMRKYQQLQSDLVVWENNIGFFSKSKNSEAMIVSVQRMIEDGKNEMKILEEKIRIIDSMENEN